MTEILERNGKYYRKVEKEEEISEIEYLKLKIAELEGRLNALPLTTIVYQGCPWPCQKDNAAPDAPYEPIWIDPVTYPTTGEPTYDHLYRPWLITY